MVITKGALIELAKKLEITGFSPEEEFILGEYQRQDGSFYFEAYGISVNYTVTADREQTEENN